MFRQMIRQVYNAETYSLTGKIENIVGMSIEASGGHAAVGDICRIYNGDSGGPGPHHQRHGPAHRRQGAL